MADIVIMKRLGVGAGETGGVWSQEFELTAGESNVFRVPYEEIYAIGCEQTNGELQFTFDTDEKIEADTAVFSDWDGSSLINLAVTAFKFVWSSGTATAKIIIKTRSV